MFCCKCKEHQWDNPQPSIWLDEMNNGYCLFHSPTARKRTKTSDFNGEVFKLIDDGHFNFAGTIFPGPISFTRNSKHSLLYCINFDNAVFEGDVYFNSGFHNKLKRNIVSFKCDVSFKHTTFCKDVDFSLARFCGYANFSFARFKGYTRFRQVSFKGHANFSSATFHGEAIFLRSVFWKSSNFRKTKFSKFTSFSKASFLDGINCAQSTFFAKVYFTKVKLFGYTDYSDCTFKGHANFYSSKFLKQSRKLSKDLLSNISLNKANFYDAHVVDVLLFRFTDFDVDVVINQVKSGKGCIVLDGISAKSLANIHFTCTDIEGFNFRSCIWPEKMRFDTDTSLSFEDREEIYRSLKQNAMNSNNQKLTGRWHYNEQLMVLQQLRRAQGWRSYISIQWLYFFCSGFGENPMQAGRALAVILTFSILVLGCLKLWETGLSLQPDLGKVLEIPAELLTLIPLVRIEGGVRIADAGLHTTVKKIMIGILQIPVSIQIALIAFALRNRFRR